MTAVLVDSNVLLDVLTRDPKWFAWSSEQVEQIADSRALVIDPVIYAEVSVHFETVEDLEAAFPSDMFRREPIPFDAAFLAGKVFLRYRQRGGYRSAPLPDFFIGAHAAIAGYALLTRDPRRYRHNFPRLRLITP